MTQDGIQNGAKDSAAMPPARTGLAIATALIAAIAFNFAYSMLFGFLASLLGGNAGDDPLWGAGVSALVAFATNFLSCLSAAAVAKRLFPRANFTQMFYAFVALLLLGGVAIGLRESVDPAGSAVVLVIYMFITATTIFGLWIYLRPGR